jgi:hypothetical protein
VAPVSKVIRLCEAWSSQGDAFEEFFDSEDTGGMFLRNVDPMYKITRAHVPDDRNSQIILLTQYLRFCMLMCMLSLSLCVHHHQTTTTTTTTDRGRTVILLKTPGMEFCLGRWSL